VETFGQTSLTDNYKLLEVFNRLFNEQKPPMKSAKMHCQFRMGLTLTVRIIVGLHTPLNYYATA